MICESETNWIPKAASKTEIKSHSTRRNKDRIRSKQNVRGFLWGIKFNNSTQGIIEVILDEAETLENMAEVKENAQRVIIVNVAKEFIPKKEMVVVEWKVTEDVTAEAGSYCSIHILYTNI